MRLLRVKVKKRTKHLPPRLKKKLGEAWKLTVRQTLLKVFPTFKDQKLHTKNEPTRQPFAHWSKRIYEWSIQAPIHGVRDKTYVLPLHDRCARVLSGTAAFCDFQATVLTQWKPSFTRVQGLSGLFGRPSLGKCISFLDRTPSVPPRELLLRFLCVCVGFEPPLLCQWLDGEDVLQSHRREQEVQMWCPTGNSSDSPVSLRNLFALQCLIRSRSKNKTGQITSQALG